MQPAIVPNFGVLKVFGPAPVPMALPSTSDRAAPSSPFHLVDDVVDDGVQADVTLSAIGESAALRSPDVEPMMIVRCRASSTSEFVIAPTRVDDDAA